MEPIDVSEWELDPDYFGLDGETFIVLLNGGDKNTQQTDIETAKSRWEHYLIEGRQGE